uniref:Protein TIC 214 n=1 Tax=Megaloselaginella exaltata TaxID=3140882 RepID=A0A7T8FZW1_9TRAC|nr:hypothetical chloroplast RF19 [Selaginella exaltata]
TQKWASPQVPVAPWADVSGPLILFGLYCGFTATLPMGLFHISLLRVPSAMGREIRGCSTGFVMGQPVIILSMYYSRLHVMLVKPHAVTLLVLPYILFYWYRILYRLRLGKEGTLRAPTGGSPAIAIVNRIYQVTSGSIIVRRSTLLDVFFPSLFLYIFLFISPAPARLAKLFVYRHCDQLLFVVSCLCGWLGGSVLLKYSAGLLVPKIDSYDSFEPRLDRRSFRQISSILTTAICLLYLGGTPWPVPYRQTRRELRSDGSNQDLSWLYAWPASFFDYRKGIRPFRYVRDCYSQASPVQMELSQHYFRVSSGAGGWQRFGFSSLPSLPILGNNWDRYVNILLRGQLPLGPDTHREWIRLNERQESYLINELTNRLESLGNGCSSSEVVDKENGFYGNGRSFFAKIHDPFISKKLRGRIVELRSNWLLLPREYALALPESYYSGYPYSSSLASGEWNTKNRRGPLSPSSYTSGNYYSAVVARLSHSPETAWLESIFKQKPRGASKLTNDIALGPLSDIRSIKVKNVNLTANKRTGILRIQKRPVLQPDYRRNLVVGSMRARRRKTLVWGAAQSRTKSTLSLRILENSAPLQSLPNMITKSNPAPRPPAVDEPRLKYFSSRAETIITRATRLSMAKRWDFPTAHWVRGCLSITQAYIRRNVVLPLLIIPKNICYLIVFQTNEWKEDWDELDKEIYVGCTYDGAEVSAQELPPHWHREGAQIKIVNSFRLKHRRRTVTKHQGLRYDDMHKVAGTIQKGRSGKSAPVRSEAEGPPWDDPNGSMVEMRYGYLTILGFQTALPFADVSRPTSLFWKPFLMDVEMKWMRTLLEMKHNIRDKFRRFDRGSNSAYPGYQEPPAVNTSIGVPSGDNTYSSAGPSARVRCSSGLNDGIKEDLFSMEVKPEYPAVTSKIEHMARPSTNELECFTRQGGTEAERPLYRGGSPPVYFGSRNRKHLRGGHEPPKPTNRMLRYIRAQLIQVRTSLRGAPSRCVYRLVFICRSSFTRFHVRLVKRLTRNSIRVHGYSIMCLGRDTEDRSWDTNPLFRDIASSNGRGDTPRGESHGRNANLISQAYAFYGAWRLGTVNKCPPSIDWGQQTAPCLSGAGRAICRSGEHGAFRKDSRSLRLSSWSSWLRNLRRCEALPSDIWCNFVPRRWNMALSRLWGEHSTNLLGDLATSVNAILRIGEESKLDFIRVGKMNKRYQSNLTLQNFMELAPILANARVYPPWQEGVLAPKPRTLIRDIHRRNRVVNFKYNGRGAKGQMNCRCDMDPNLRLWLCIEIFRQFNILEKTEGLTAHRLHTIMCEPNIFSGSGGRRRIYAGRGDGSYQYVEKLFGEDRLDRWDLRSEQISARIMEVRDNINALRALSAVSTNSGENTRRRVTRLGSLYEGTLGEIALLSYYARADGTKNGMLSNIGHFLGQVVNDRFLTCNMLNALLNFQNRFQQIIFYYITPHEGPMLRLRLLGNGKKTISYPSYIDDVLLPKRRVERIILESLSRRWVDFYGNQGAGAGAITAGGPEQHSEELLTQNRNTGGETQIRMKGILWPGYRLEDLSCMNRFWSNTHEGGRLAMLRVCSYPSKTFTIY